MDRYKHDLTIIIPFFFGNKSLLKLLNSFVTSGLFNEGTLAVELILVNDSPQISVGEIEVILESFFCYFRRTEIIQNNINVGVAASRNKGLDSSTGQWIYIIDQDDEVLQSFSQVVRKALKGNFDFILMNGLYCFELYKSKTHPIYFFKPLLNLRKLIRAEIIRSPGQVLIKRELLRNLKFPEPPGKFYGADDRFFWIILFAEYPFLKVLYDAGFSYKANIHLSNTGADSKKLWLSSLSLWDDFVSKYNFSQNGLVNRNILLLKFRLRQFDGMTIKDFFVGLYEFIRHSCDLNKIFRFYSKKIIQLKSIALF